MIRKRTISKSYPIVRWLLNLALFISVLLSFELTQQPQHFQSYHTELALPADEASRDTVTYPRSCCDTDVKEVYQELPINSFFHAQLHYSSFLRTKLKNTRLIVPTVSTAVRYLQFQSNLSESDEDLSLALRG